MKKIMVLPAAALFSLSAAFAQDKPKSKKELRDSVFTVMKLSDENRKKFHNLIAESGKAQKSIKEDASLSDEAKKEKLKANSKTSREIEKALLTPGQQKIWADFQAAQKNRSEGNK